jgi:hypothetical protein
MIWDWKPGDTFRFFVQKRPGIAPDTTDTRYYVFDRSHNKWLHEATITNPNGGKESVATIGGGLNSFLENFGGRDRTLPKLALYRLWLGSSPDKMTCLTHASGDGIWGKLTGTGGEGAPRDAYFLAEGASADLNRVFATWKKKGYGNPVMGENRKKLDPIAGIPLDKHLIDALKSLPDAPEIVHFGFVRPAHAPISLPRFLERSPESAGSSIAAIKCVALFGARAVAMGSSP